MAGAVPPFPSPHPRKLPPDSGPLRGIRVLECGEAYAVPYLTRLLADLGADVIKVESRIRPDVSRVWPFPNNEPGDEFWNRGGIFNEPNRNKRGITLDLRSQAGAEVFKRLIATADVLCENYTPRVMAQFGLAYDTLVSVKPDLIMLSSTGYGHSGPWTNYTGWGFTLEPTAGISNYVGRPDGPPLRTGIAYVDMPAAAIGAHAVLAALRYRRRTGRGQWIDLAQYEVGASFVGEALVAAAAGADPGARTGNRHRVHAPQGVYRCRGEGGGPAQGGDPQEPGLGPGGGLGGVPPQGGDPQERGLGPGGGLGGVPPSDRWVALTVDSDARFDALCMLIDRPELPADPRFDTAEARRANHDDLDAIVTGWTSAHTAEDAAEQLRAVGIPAAVAMCNRDLLLDPHLRERRFFELATHRPEAGDLGTRPYPGWAMRLYPVESACIRQASPLLGQDNEAILDEVGVDADQRAVLEGDGVIGRTPAAGRIPGTSERVVAQAQLVESGLVQECDPDFMERLGLG